MIYREFILPGVSLRQVSTVFLSAWRYLQREEWERSRVTIECYVTEVEGFGVCFEVGLRPDPMLVVGACQLDGSGLSVAIGLIDQTRSVLANDTEDIFDNFAGKIDYRPPSRPLPLWMLVLDAPGGNQYLYDPDKHTGSPDPTPAPASSAAGDDQVMTAGTLKPKPTGRPRDKHYDWAYAQICDGRHRDEVYQEYLAHWRKEGNDPEQEKEDARSAFDEAMIYRQKKAAGK